MKAPKSWSPYFHQLRFRRKYPDWAGFDDGGPCYTPRHARLRVKRYHSVVLKECGVVKRVRHAGSRKPSVHEEQPR